MDPLLYCSESTRLFYLGLPEGVRRKKEKYPNINDRLEGNTKRGNQDNSGYVGVMNNFNIRVANVIQ